MTVFDFATNQLVPVGNGVRQYKPDKLDFGPRVGLSWDPFGKARTVLRAGVGLYYDVPLLSASAAMENNPPFATTSTFTYTGIALSNPFVPGSTAALSPNAMTPDYKGARVPQYNFNIQQQAWSTVFQAGYIGSAGRRLAVQRDYNQGVAGVRPIAGYGQINLYGSTARSSYNAFWLSANRRLARGLTFDASYTFSKSIDTASTSGNAQIQNANDLNAENALSDFDARNRVVASIVYQFPWKARRFKLLANDWSMSVVGNYQSGNPFSPIISSLRSGSLNTNDRPDVVYGQSPNLDSPDPARFFNTAAFVLNQTNHFGNAGRNILTGPVLRDADISFLKLFPVRDRLAVQFRAKYFNVANTPNFGEPGNSVTAANFGVVQTTRSQRGDFSSSRQIEFALKVLF
ncbi:MAG: hypothetical protein QOJ99_2195 [Bryobacterales bacterium]|nr:hypothetical protein [Bryobacterales bacterium]